MLVWGSHSLLCRLVHLASLFFLAALIIMGLSCKFLLAGILSWTCACIRVYRNNNMALSFVGHLASYSGQPLLLFQAAG